MNKKFHFVSQHIHKHPVAFGAIIVAGFINSCISFLLPVSVGEFFQLYFHTGSSKGKLFNWLGLHIGTAEQFFFLFAVLLLLKIIFSYAENIGTYRHGELFVKELREKIFAAQANWQSPVFLQRPYGKYLLRYSNDMKAVQNYFMKGVIGGIMNSLFLITGLFLLSQINFRLAILFFSMLAATFIIIYFLSAIQKPFIRASRSNRSSLLAFVAKSFARFREIKETQSESATTAKFNLRSDNLYLSNMRSNRMESLLLAASPFLIFVMIGLILWQMTLSYVSITVSEGVMMILMMLMMQGTLRKLFKIPAYFNKGKISLQKISKLLRQENDSAEIVSESSQNG